MVLMQVAVKQAKFKTETNAWVDLTVMLLMQEEVKLCLVEPKQQ